MRHVLKPWGYELIWAQNEHYVGKLLHLNAGHRLSRQYHQKKDETMLVLSGELIVEIGVEGSLVRRVLRPQDTLRIKPNTIHRLIAEVETELIEVSTPELDDVVRLEDLYGRITKQ